MSAVVRIAFDPPLPSELTATLSEQLGFCSEHVLGLAVDGEGRHVDVRVSADGCAGQLSADVVSLADRLRRGWRPLAQRRLYQHRVDPPHHGPIWDELCARGLVHEESPGCVALRGAAVEVLEALDERLAAIAKYELGAQPQRYPTLLSTAELDRCGYFAGHPHHVTFALRVRRDLDALTEIARGSDHGPDSGLAAHLAAPAQALTPAICYHVYAALKDRPLPVDEVVTAAGRCFRYEAGRFATLERGWEFSMREIVFVGGRDFVDMQRRRGLEIAARLVEELDLDAWIETAHDPFFADAFASRTFFQLTTESKYELRLALPYSGASLAAASFNDHRDLFGRSFAITREPRFAFSACIGFGLERWTWALFAQLGPEIGRWPERVRRGLGL